MKMGKGKVAQDTRKNGTAMRSKRLLTSKLTKISILKNQSKKKTKLKKKRQKGKDVMIKRNENFVVPNNDETVTICRDTPPKNGEISPSNEICNIATDETNSKDQTKCNFESVEAVNAEFENDQDKKKEKEIVRFIEFNSNSKYYGILFLAMNQEVGIKGYGKLAILCGQCECYGYTIYGTSSEAHYLDWFSPTTSSLLTIKASPSSLINSSEKSKLLKQLKMMSIPSKQLTDIDICNMASCILFKQLKSHKPLFLKMYNNFQGFPTNYMQIFGKPFSERVYCTDSWKEVLQNITSERELIGNTCHCSVMVCGGKDVGKSSFAKYIINDWLKCYDAVFYLECDCGQTEFTPPAVLSLVKVTKPLLGPSYTHSITIEKSFFYGYISPKDDPQEYSKIIESIFLYYRQRYSGSFPLIINQQGWVRGLGLSLLVDSLRIISPCFAVQIYSDTMQSRNLEQDLSDDFIKNQQGWNVAPDYQSICQRTHRCIYMKMKTVGDEKSKRSSKGSTSRNLNISSYLSDLYKESYNFVVVKNNVNDWIPPSLSVMPPYKLKWNKVGLHVMHEKLSKEAQLLALNMALVSLAKVDNDLIENESEKEDLPKFLHSQPLAEYIGMGIVRNIDVVNKLYYILTPEPIERLDEVNALIRGNVELPSSFFHQNNSGCSLYFTSDSVGSISKFARKAKVRFNLKRKPSKMRNSMAG